MKKQNAVQRKVTKIGLAMAAVAGSSLTMAQGEVVPAEILGLFTSGAAIALLVIAAGSAAYAAYRGALVALTVAKRMLSKVGL